jgi:hypothetical protein
MPDLITQQRTIEQNPIGLSLSEPLKDKALRQIAEKARPEPTIPSKIPTQQNFHLAHPVGRNEQGATEESRSTVVTPVHIPTQLAPPSPLSSQIKDKLSQLSHSKGSPDMRDSDGVYLCKRPAQIAMGLVNHHWIYTKNLEVGVGNCDGSTPGNQSDLPYIAETCVNDHANEAHGPDTVCTKIEGVEESCIRSRATIGASNGQWTLLNHCQSWSASILEECRTASPTRPMPAPGPIPTRSE